ncbi:hypothetical protein [Desulfococcus multivorans]|uniref:hypothetical protein n=1 Tax=Desulfococcus multivorans TaxID=897 RepID=UPI001181257B|nr:hypothetical protein [Desulfococcus multivorans]
MQEEITEPCFKRLVAATFGLPYLFVGILSSESGRNQGDQVSGYLQGHCSQKINFHSLTTDYDVALLACILSVMVILDVILEAL